jgi:hypothetical protein
MEGARMMKTRSLLLFTLLAVGLAAHAPAGSIVQVDITGSLSGIDDMETINGQTLTNGMTYDATFYFDPTDLISFGSNPGSPPPPIGQIVETIYADPSQGDSLVLNGVVSNPAISDSSYAEMGAELVPETDSQNNPVPYYDQIFLNNSADSMAATFAYLDGGPTDTSFDSIENALINVAPTISSFAIYSDQENQIAGSIDSVTVSTASPVPLPPATEAALVLLGGYGLFAALRKYRRPSRMGFGA